MTDPTAGALAGLKVVVSAGPTFEDIDPVRFIGNRSSGKMGFAVAAAAAERTSTRSTPSGVPSATGPATSVVRAPRAAAAAASANPS